MKIIFKDIRFSLSLFGISLARTIFYSSYICVTALAFVALFSDISQISWFGFLVLLFLGDRLFRIGKGDRKITELPDEEKNVARTLTPRSFRLLDHAFRKAVSTHEHPYFIILTDLAEDRGIQKILLRLSVDPKEFLTKVSEFSVDAKETINKETSFAFVEKIGLRAFENALELRDIYIEPWNIFSAICSTNHPQIVKLLYLFDVKPADVSRAVLFSHQATPFSGFFKISSRSRAPRQYRRRVMNRAWTARPTPTLDRVSDDLTTLADAGTIGFLIGHTKEFDALLTTISRPGKPNAILVGEPGSGRSTIVEHLAYRMVKDDVPSVLFDKRLVLLRVSEFISEGDEKDVGGRVEKIISEILAAGNIVLVIPNAEDLFKGISEKGMRPIDYLLPIVKSAAIPVICETYPREFKKLIEPRTDFLEQFEIIPIEEISEDDAAKLLVYEGLSLEREFSIIVGFKAIRKAIELAHRYFRNRMLPGSATDLLKQAVAEAHQAREKIVLEENVISVAERQSKIPIQRAEGSEVDSLLHLEKTIHEKFINQTEAVSGVARALREYRSGLARRGGPIATFLFVGPTGVGKTELAKILTDIQFGSRDVMRRFDMSEYQDKQSIFQLIGTPNGEKSGALTDAILQNPYSLVLLDEFEKAHGDILNLFLQVFDDGRLTDSLGRTVDFQNTIIIATSNAHSDFIKSEIESGKTIADISETVKKKLTDYFKPELVNRFSQIVVFRNLNQEETKQVAALAINELSATLLDTHGIKITVAEEALVKIAELGYSPVFGARPLRQVISEKIRSVLAEKILKKEIARGNALKIIFENNQFDFKVIE
jgi:ATP-dependent Clp protease ATP-binding subunit ClpA